MWGINGVLMHTGHTYFWNVLKHSRKPPTSSWSFRLVFSRPSILVWRSPTVQLGERRKDIGESVSLKIARREWP